MEYCGSKPPILIPYQQLIHILLYLLYGNDMGSFSYTRKLWEEAAHSYTITAAYSHFAVPALWNYIWDRSVTQENCVLRCKKSKKRFKKTSHCFCRISEQYIQIQWGYFWQNMRCLGSWRVFEIFSQLNRNYSFQFPKLQSLQYDFFCLNLLNYQNTFEEECWKVVRMYKKTSAHIYITVKRTCFNYYISFHFKPLQVYPT